MASTKIVLPNGTTVAIEGTPEEITKVLSLYGGVQPDKSNGKVQKETSKRSKSNSKVTDKNSDQPDLNALVHAIKTCEDAEKIEKQILDKNSVLERVLLPLFALEEIEMDIDGLTSGDISKVLKELGTPIDVANVSITLSRKGRAYVTGDKVRKKGVAVRYKIIRRGIQHLRKVLDTADE